MTDFARPENDPDAETEDERNERQNREDWVAAHTCPTCGVVEDRRVHAPADDDACPDCGSVDPDDAVVVGRVRTRQAAAMLPHAVETLDALAAKIADLWAEARRQAGGYVSDVAGRGIVYPDDGAQREAYAIEWFRTQVGLIGNDLGSLADYLRPLTR